MARVLVALTAAVTCVAAMASVQRLEAVLAQRSMPLPAGTAAAGQRTIAPGSVVPSRAADPQRERAGGASWTSHGAPDGPMEGNAEVVTGPVTPRSAIDALAAGRYREALARYQRLQQQFPNVAAYSQAARILQLRMAAHWGDPAF